MNSTVAVVSTVSRLILTNILKFSVRYQKKPKTIAHTQAAIAPSVGVNTPVVMPPIRITGVMMGNTAWKLKNLSAANKTIRAANTVICGGVPMVLTSHQIAIGQPITTAVSAKALMTLGHSNFTSAPQPFLCAK